MSAKLWSWMSFAQNLNRNTKLKWRRAFWFRIVAGACQLNSLINQLDALIPPFMSSESSKLFLRSTRPPSILSSRSEKTIQGSPWSSNSTHLSTLIRVWKKLKKRRQTIQSNRQAQRQDRFTYQRYLLPMLIYRSVRRKIQINLVWGKQSQAFRFFPESKLSQSKISSKISWSMALRLLKSKNN